MGKVKLNLGCGTDYKKHWINIDKGDCKCDVQHDLEQFPYPFDNDSVDKILLQHVFEHIDPKNFYNTMKELYRICKNNAIIEIISPLAGTDNYFTDPTHKMPLTQRTFDFFDPSKPLYENGKIYKWTDVKLIVEEAVRIPAGPNGDALKHRLRIIK